jgi:hypothetical protein
MSFAPVRFLVLFLYFFFIFFMLSLWVRREAVWFRQSGQSGPEGKRRCYYTRVENIFLGLVHKFVACNGKV